MVKSKAMKILSLGWYLTVPLSFIFVVTGMAVIVLGVLPDTTNDDRLKAQLAKMGVCFVGWGVSAFYAGWGLHLSMGTDTRKLIWRVFGVGCVLHTLFSLLILFFGWVTNADLGWPPLWFAIPFIYHLGWGIAGVVLWWKGNRSVGAPPTP